MVDTVYGRLAASTAPMVQFARRISTHLLHGFFGATVVAVPREPDQYPEHNKARLAEMLAPFATAEKRREMACWFTGRNRLTGEIDADAAQVVPRTTKEPKSVRIFTDNDSSIDGLFWVGALAEVMGRYTSVPSKNLSFCLDPDVLRVLIEHMNLTHLSGKRLAMCGMTANQCIWLCHLSYDGHDRVVTAYAIDISQQSAH